MTFLGTLLTPLHYSRLLDNLLSTGGMLLSSQIVILSLNAGFSSVTGHHVMMRQRVKTAQD